MAELREQEISRRHLCLPIYCVMTFGSVLLARLFSVSFVRCDFDRIHTTEYLVVGDEEWHRRTSAVVRVRRPWYVLLHSGYIMLTQETPLAPRPRPLYLEIYKPQSAEYAEYSPRSHRDTIGL